MRLIERAYFSMKQTKIKSLLFLLAITLLSTFLSTTFSIFQANKSLEKTIYEQLKPIILIDWNHNNKDGIFTYDNESKVQEIVDNLKHDSKVYYIENRYSLGLDNYNYHIDLVLKNNNFKILNFQEGKVITINGKSVSSFDLIGVDSYLLSDLNNKNYELIYGEGFTKEEIDNGDNVFLFIAGFDPMEHYLQKIIDSKCIYLSFENILFYNFINDYTESNEIFDYKEKFKLKGILEKVYEYPTELKYHVGSYTGKLIVPFNTLKKLSGEFITYIKQYEDKYDFLKENRYLNSGQLYFVEDSYILLNDTSEIDGFINHMKNVYGIYIDNIYSFSDSYNDVKGITRNLNFIAIISLVTCSIASIVLLSLIIQVIVNERKYEIGVYLSMGEKRINVIKQIVLEVLIIGLLGITLSLFAGNMIARTFSNDLLEKQITQMNNVNDVLELEETFELDKDEIINAYQVEINTEYVTSVYAGGILVLLISCIVPMNGIMKMKVKKMLL